MVERWTPASPEEPAATAALPGTDELGALSERELEVLALVTTGVTNQQIARSLKISPNTVKVHLRNIYEKLGVQSRTEATMEAVRRGWVVVGGTGGSAPATEAVAGTADAEGAMAGAIAPGTAAPGLATLVSSVAVAPVLAPLRPPQPIALWQRVYMLAAALLVILAVGAPGWWQGRSQAMEITAISDLGQPQVSEPPRAKVARWTSRASLPEGRSRLALAQAGGKLYAIGGETAEGVTGELAVYDPRSNGWLQGTSKPTAVSNVSAVTIDDLIYVPGGSTEGGLVVDTLEVYAPATEKWETRARLPAPRAAYGLATLKGKLYLFGGWDGKQYRAETFAYDPATDTWQNGSPLPSPRGFLAASALKDVIYVAGGYDGQHELNAVDTYDPAAEETAEGPWSSRAPLDQARAGLALLAASNRLYAVGGGWTTPIAYNEQYDVQTGAWSHIESPIEGQWRNLALALQGDSFFAVGGWSGTYMATTEQYTVVFRLLLPLNASGD